MRPCPESSSVGQLVSESSAIVARQEPHVPELGAGLVQTLRREAHDGVALGGREEGEQPEPFPVQRVDLLRELGALFGADALGAGGEAVRFGVHASPYALHLRRPALDDQPRQRVRACLGHRRHRRRGQRARQLHAAAARKVGISSSYSPSSAGRARHVRGLAFADATLPAEREILTLPRSASRRSRRATRVWARSTSSKRASSSETSLSVSVRPCGAGTASDVSSGNPAAGGAVSSQPTASQPAVATASAHRRPAFHAIGSTLSRPRRTFSSGPAPTAGSRVTLASHAKRKSGRRDPRETSCASYGLRAVMNQVLDGAHTPLPSWC